MLLIQITDNCPLRITAKQFEFEFQETDIQARNATITEVPISV